MPILVFFFFFNDTATTEIYTSIDTLSLHDALPIHRIVIGVRPGCGRRRGTGRVAVGGAGEGGGFGPGGPAAAIVFPGSPSDGDGGTGTVMGYPARRLHFRLAFRQQEVGVDSEQGAQGDAVFGTRH